MDAGCAATPKAKRNSLLSRTIRNFGFPKLLTGFPQGLNDLFFRHVEQGEPTSGEQLAYLRQPPRHWAREMAGMFHYFFLHTQYTRLEQYPLGLNLEGFLHLSLIQAESDLLNSLPDFLRT